MLNSKAIYIIEDNPNFLSQTIQYLNNKNNFSIAGYSTVEECLLYNNYTPSLIVMNYNLNSFLPSAINGLKALKIIKQLYKETKILFFSNQDSIEVALELINEGANDYIVKETKIENLLEQKSLETLQKKVIELI